MMLHHLKDRDAIDFGPCVKTKMAAIELFNMYAIDTPCEAIALEPPNQLTSNLVYEVILPKGRTLFILGHVQKLRWLPSNFLMYAIDTPCERDIFRTA